jgi:hypothetical protein
VVKQAIIGMTPVKMWILKAFDLSLKKPIQPFSTFDEATNYLAAD